MKTYRNKTINALHDSNLQTFLKKIGVYEDIINKNKKCKFTGQLITMENIYSIFKQSGDIKIVSDDPVAIKQFLEFLDNKK